MNKLESILTKYSPVLSLMVIVAMVILVMNGGVSRDGIGATAIVDLDKVAVAIGRSDVITDEVDAFISAEEEKLQATKQEFIALIEKVQQTIGEEPNQEESKQLVQLTRKSNIELQKIAGAIRNSTDQLKVALVSQFRNEVEPIVRQVAEARSFSLVEIKSPGYIYIKSEIDISDDVIDKLLMLKSSDKNDLASEQK